MIEAELKKRCLVRGWLPSNFTYYLLESKRTAGSIAVLMSASLGTTNYWLHNELTRPISFFFLMVRKLKLQYNIDLFDLV